MCRSRYAFCRPFRRRTRAVTACRPVVAGDRSSDRVKSVRCEGGNLGAYDALGRRVSTTTREGTIRHVYDDRWQCLADIDERGDMLRSYVWGEGIDNLLAVRIGTETYTALTDIQGTVWGFTDSSGGVVARWTYDAWGNVLSEDVAVLELATLRYRFQGREWSAATGLINFRMRWYDADARRWLSKDSAGLKGGINLFVLCRNDPVNFFDADGCGFLGLFAKTAKMTWKLISRTHAEKMLKKHQTVTMKGKGCGKKAKRLVESATGKKTVRHDGHGPGQAPHYQPKNGGGAHVRVPGAHLTEGMGLFGDAIDFFNPLSDAQDLIDLVQDVVESFD